MSDQPTKLQRGFDFHRISRQGSEKATRKREMNGPDRSRADLVIKRFSWEQPQAEEPTR